VRPENRRGSFEHSRWVARVFRRRKIVVFASMREQRDEPDLRRIDRLAAMRHAARAAIRGGDASRQASGRSGPPIGASRLTIERRTRRYFGVGQGRGRPNGCVRNTSERSQGAISAPGVRPLLAQVLNASRLLSEIATAHYDLAFAQWAGRAPRVMCWVRGLSRA